MVPRPSAALAIYALQALLLMHGKPRSHAGFSSRAGGRTRARRCRRCRPPRYLRRGGASGGPLGGARAGGDARGKARPPLPGAAPGALRGRGGRRGDARSPEEPFGAAPWGATRRYLKSQGAGE